MTMNRHEPFEELISASLHRRPDRRRARAARRAPRRAATECRATLAAFADQRRIVAGLRHVAPPRDLGARVRDRASSAAHAAAVVAAADGRSSPASAAAWRVVAGALLALVLLNGSTRAAGRRRHPPPLRPADVRGQRRPRSRRWPSLATCRRAPRRAPAPAGDAAPSAERDAGANAVPASPEPDVFLAPHRRRSTTSALTVHERHRRASHRDRSSSRETPTGAPIAAELSPDGQWLAYITSWA